MKPLSRFRIAALSLMALVAITFASKSFASVNMYLDFKDVDGKVTKVSVASDGSFSSPELPAGTYTVTCYFGHGPRQTTSLDGSVVDGRGLTPDDQNRKKSKIEAMTFEYDIVSPRDHASGLPTGKRMHKPFNIKFSDSERLLPTVNKKVGSIAIDEPGVHLTGKIILSDHDGKPMAADDWMQTK